MSSGSDLAVHHDEAVHRFVLERSGQPVGMLAYRPVGRPSEPLVDVYTTQIDPSCRGQGLGDVLVRGALDELRAQGTSVKASCWFVADFLDANPDYQDLREGARRPTAAGIPEERAPADVARDAHDHGMADTAPDASDGAPGRPPTEDR